MTVIKAIMSYRSGERLAYEKNLAKGAYKAEDLTSYLHVHPAEACSLKPCSIHSPSGHMLRAAPLLYSRDSPDLMWRLCPHNRFHPDPDSVPFAIQQLDLMAAGTSRLDNTQKALFEANEHWKVCDGCCVKPKARDALWRRQKQFHAEETMRRMQANGNQFYSTTTANNGTFTWVSTTGTSSPF